MFQVYSHLPLSPKDHQKRGLKRFQLLEAGSKLGGFISGNCPPLGADTSGNGDGFRAPFPSYLPGGSENFHPLRYQGRPDANQGPPPPSLCVGSGPGRVLPACLCVCTSGPSRTQRARECVCVCVSVSVHTLVPPTLHSATSRPPSCRTAVPFTSPTCQGTRRRASPCGISVRHGLCDFFGEQCLAVWTQVARLQCHPERNFLSVRSDPEMACAALGERARALS